MYLRAAHKLDKSGWTVLDYLNQAHLLWMNDRKTTFTHGPCMNVLVDLPKFSLEGPLVTNTGDKASNPVKAVFGAVLKGPIGRDAAKAEAKGKKVKVEGTSVFVEAMSRKNDLLEMKTATIKIALEAKNMNARKKLQLSRHDQLLKEAALWAKMGNNDKAKELLEMIADERKKTEQETPQKSFRTTDGNDDNDVNDDADSDSDSA